uniref:Male-enhanced antigen 1 n=1 Tax=Monopterus albus TaxID=43700 RepID=A0A3Q3QI10_MONAL
MEVWSSVMGPERVLPSSEEELGEDQRPADGEEQGGDMELDVEEEEEEVSSGGYYYQPLNQDPDGVNGTEQPEDEEEEQSHVEQLQQVQHQIEEYFEDLLNPSVMSSDEEAEAGVSPFPVRSDHVELVKRTMATVALPSLGVPAWAQEISDDQWKDMVQHTLQSRQSASALRLSHRGDP